MFMMLLGNSKNGQSYESWRRRVLHAQINIPKLMVTPKSDDIKPKDEHDTPQQESAA